MKVLVSGAGSLLGQGIIKSLQTSSRDYEIYAADYFRTAVGLYWSKKSFLLPDFLDAEVSEDLWLRELIKIISKEFIDVLVPGLDFELPLLARHKEKIERVTPCRVIVSDERVVGIGNDKWETVKFLKESGFSFPYSSLAKNKEEFLDNCSFPFIIKPRIGNTSKDVFLVKSKIELTQALEKVTNPILQEYLGSDEDEYTCGSTYVSNEIVTSIALKRKLKNGNTDMAFLEDSDPLEDYINKVTHALKPFGPTNFQLRLHKGKPVIFEINPRFSGTTPIRALFGVNEVEATLEAVLRGVLDYKSNKKPGVILRYMENQFIEWEDFNSFKE